jgi:hypothetical protein
MFARASFHITPRTNNIASLCGINFNTCSTFEKSLKNISATNITVDVFGNVLFDRRWVIAVAVGFLLS